ncbi:MAG: BlaI/MecI/CopY family transcriptional regulator [Planctomycetota bacterium]
MARSKQAGVSNMELQVLNTLWRLGTTTVREVTGEVYDDQSFSKYQSVQKLLERLEEKGFVLRDRSTSTHSFRAAMSREDFLGRELEAMAEKLCGGSLTPILMHLAGRSRLKSTEREALAKLISRGKS